jgi:sulfur carrier protein ThiS
MFTKQAGFDERTFELPSGATVADALAQVAAAAPTLDCVEGGTVDLALASFSVNGKPVDARAPGAAPLADGDACYLYGAISGG